MANGNGSSASEEGASSTSPSNPERYVGPAQGMTMAYMPGGAQVLVGQQAVGKLKGADVFKGADGNYYTTFDSGSGWTGAQGLSQSQVVEMMRGSAPGQQTAQQPGITGPLAQLWNQYQGQGQQQAQQQPQFSQPQIPQPQASAPGQSVINQAMSSPSLSPVATVPPIQGSMGPISPFAPPPPPAPGQQPGQNQQLPGYQGGGLVQGGSDQASYFYPGGVQPQQQGQQPQQSAQQSQTGAWSPQYGFSALGAGALGGMPMVINPTPNQGPLSKGGVYTGPQNATVYGTQTPTAPTQAFQGMVTLPNGAQLTPAQMTQYLQSPPDQQRQVAQAMGLSPADLQQAANQSWGQQGQPAFGAGGGSTGGGGATGGWGAPGIQNAPTQYVSSQGSIPAGPWSVMPGPFNAAAMPAATPTPMITPQLPANAAGVRPGGTGVAWASAPLPGQTALPPGNVQGMPPQTIGGPVAGIPPGNSMIPPAAPTQGGGGVQLSGATGSGFAAAHNSALADAGMALYAHFGGDPSTATPKDIANFHRQLTDHIGGALGGGALKANSGGLVPGRGNTDSVLALLTPGEYIVPKSQVHQLFGAKTPVKMQSGGLVPDDQDEPPEIAGLTPANQTMRNIANLQARRTMAQNAALSANTPAYPSATTAAAQGYAAAANAGKIGGAAPTAAQVQGAAAMTPAQTQGSIAKANMGGIGSAIGGLASGLAQAAQTYADSIKPWQMQQQAFGPPAAPTGPAAQFAQQPSPQGQQRQQVNPSVAAMYGYV
jgi:hypothetical protein